ncbi:lysozyme [Arthrobacter oryzae]|uniref:lysozyme n=1 Tax=Arthrobacter oryzae TaxID=409290 RepID=UPI0027879956|nr:lysozyme [Arthrobacter oryzae]MDQ0075272.1 GH25 family lysozyme M1 (1,4-beta-N-acetylmuramidase)/acyl-CoA hydrolase [Arthrobacter oryzae]
MKRNPETHRPSPRSRFGSLFLAAALLVGPGFAVPASAVEPEPTATPAAPTGTASPSTSPSPDPVVAQPPTPAPAPAETPAAMAPSTDPATVPDPTSDAGRAAMATAVGPGGAEMGQRSARVTTSAKLLQGAKSLTTQSMETQGTWSPTFGVKGLDVSGHQASVDWLQQWNMGARFAYVKASEGNYYTNPSYSSQYNGSRNVGMIRGAYHFAIPNWSSGADQARYFVQNGGGWSPDGYTLPPVLDFEFNPYEGRTINGFYFGNTCYGMSPGQLASWVRDFGNTMLAMTGRLPMIYTNTNWWNQCLGNPSGFGDYPLWIAAYPSSPTNNAGPVPTSSWSTYSMWQYSSTGPFAGDSNVWNGDYASLSLFTGTRPQGSFDTASIERTGTTTALKIRGWALDRALPGATTEVHAYVTAPNGTKTLHEFPATAYRPDVNKVLGLGDNHGFDNQIPIKVSGKYTVCVFAIGKFINPGLGCKSLTVDGAEPPIGSFDEFSEQRSPDKESLKVRGWAVDMSRPSVTSEVHAYLYGPDGGSTLYKIPANTSRPDVDRVLSVGSNHGFETNIDISKAGNYKLCAYAIGLYLHSELGCRTIKVAPGTTPVGTLDSVSVKKTSSQASLSVRGWAIDYGNTSAQIPVHAYVLAPNGTSTLHEFTASKARPDVNTVLGVPGSHGYEADLPISGPGKYRVCTYAIALSPVSPGNPLLGCSYIDAGFSASPVGYLDSVRIESVSGITSVVAAGWTVDQDVPSESLSVHTYVTAPDGSVTNFAVTANQPRPDVNQALGISGDHGYTAKKAVSQRGTYRICTYAIAASPFTTGNSLLGCKNITY